MKLPLGTESKLNECRGMWEAAISLVDDFIARVSADQSERGSVVEMASASRELTFTVIAKAGFGVDVKWDQDDEEGDQSGLLGLGHTLKGTLRLLILRRLVPSAS